MRTSGPHAADVPDEHPARSPEAEAGRNGVSGTGVRDTGDDVTRGSGTEGEMPPRRRGPRRAVRRGTEREAVPGVSEDERGGHDSNDERLRRDVPPHW